MHDAMIFLLAVAVLILAAVLWMRRPQAATSQEAPPDPGTSLPVHVEELPVKVFLNPLKDLTFRESIQNAQVFYEHIGMSLVRDLDRASLPALGNVTSGSLQAGALANESILVKLQGGGYLMQTGDGATKPLLMGSDGRITEIGNVDWTGQFLARGAGDVGLVVAISHIISSADLSRRLAQVQTTINRLAVYHEARRVGTIRTLYESLAEAFERGDEADMRRCREKIRQQRNILIEELQRTWPALQPLPRPLLRLRKPSRQSVDDRIRELDEAASKVLLVDYCVRLEMLALAGIPDRVGLQLWLSDTAREMGQLADLMDPLERDLSQRDTNASDDLPAGADLCRRIGAEYAKVNERERQPRPLSSGART